MSHLILGTAGHIDHGKTALVQALTGTDTDRLKEEKERGITIELGFAELDLGDHVFGVVDVPGHEAFVRSMVAGAAGMDLVLLVVAVDEGVMPQTREHLAIVQLLGVSGLVVALTKCDTVDDEWIDLVRADVADLLDGTPYAAAVMVPTSATSGEGLEVLCDALREAAQGVTKSAADDLVRIPLDRVFTIQGTGTVVTGTVWTGTLNSKDRVRILPNDLDARIRAVQVHGRDVDSAAAGDRAAVALSGDGADRAVVTRGATLVTGRYWSPTWMLTTRVRLLDDTPWTLEHNQRVRVHVGTAEVMARCALLQADPIKAAQEGWVQLRLEEPVVARARDRIVLRAYSPVITIGGGSVAEPAPPKRSRLDDALRSALTDVIDGGPTESVAAAVSVSAWRGSTDGELPLQTGLAPAAVSDGLAILDQGGALRAGQRVFGDLVVAEATAKIRRAVEEAHEADSLKASIPLSVLRSALPSWAASELADGVIERLLRQGALEVRDGGVHLPGHTAELSSDQEVAARELLALYTKGGLAAPLADELPKPLLERPDVWSLIKFLETGGKLVPIADGYYAVPSDLNAAVGRVRELLGGQTGLGPSAFREALPVTRKHLIPLLNYLDGLGVTIRNPEGRDVPI
jgi:selenocysteine-specific elongation factor